MGSVLRLRWLLPALAGVAVAIFVSVLGSPSGRAAAVPLSISISGNHFVNGAGQTIRLLGADHESAEYACVQGWGYNDGHFDDADAAALAAWHINAVRIPLNEDCWLGANSEPDTMDGDPSLTPTGYQQAVEQYVTDLNAHGIYAILDLHWSAPGTQVAAEQQPMPDLDHSPTFWNSVAEAFKSNPAVVFDLYNEPYDPTLVDDQNHPQDKVTWDCWENAGLQGHTCSTAAYDENAQPTATTYHVAGMQLLVNTIRATGASQPIMVGGLAFANDLSQWVENAPDDPQNQEAASFHNYQGEACDNATCWNDQIASVAANVPVVTGEFAEDDFDNPSCANHTPSTFDDDYMNWADQHGVSYLAWTWGVLTGQELSDAGCSAYFLNSDWTGTPAAPNGTALHDHLAALVTSTTTTTTSSTTTPTTTTTGTTGTTTTGPAGGSHPGGAKPSLTHLGVALTTPSTLAFSLLSNHACSATLQVQTASRYVVPAVARRRVHVVLGKVRFTLKANRRRTITVRLSGAAQRLIKKHRTLRVTTTITLTDAAGTRVTHRTLTLHHH